MGKPKASSSQGELPPYRDDPSYDDAVSLHTTGGREDDDVPNIGEDTLAEPPPYTDEAFPSNSNAHNINNDSLAEQPQEYSLAQGILTNNYSTNKYNGEYSELDNGKVLVYSNFYDTNAEVLCEDVMRWGRTPPEKMIVLKGTHTQTIKNGDKQEKKTITDFEIKMRLTEYLFTHRGDSAWRETKAANMATKTYRGSILKRKAKDTEMEEGEVSVLGWCERYVNNPARLKVFNFTRTVTGLDEHFLRDHLEALVRSTSYRGHISVTFPILNPTVDVYSNKRINRLRNNFIAGILAFITLTFLIIWPLLFLFTKRYEVVKAEWPFAKIDPDTGNFVFATISEQQWFEKWAKLIERSVVGKQQVTLTQEDLARGVDVNFPRTGNEVVDGAATLFGTGMRVFNEVNRQLGWGGDC